MDAKRSVLARPPAARHKEIYSEWSTVTWVVGPSPYFYEEVFFQPSTFCTAKIARYAPPTRFLSALKQRFIPNHPARKPHPENEWISWFLAFQGAVHGNRRHTGGEPAAAWCHVRKLRAAAYADVAMLPYRHVLWLLVGGGAFRVAFCSLNPQSVEGMWYMATLPCGHIGMCFFSVWRAPAPVPRSRPR